MDLYVALLTFPVVFVGELPDKTMFASLILATKGRPAQVWLGAAGAFVVHVAIAVTVGAALVRLAPHRVVEGVVAAMFALGAVYAWWESRAEDEEEERIGEEASRHGAVVTAFVVIFLAEWGDLTQVLITNLAARYHSALSVSVGSLAALWAVAAIAVASGQTLLRYLRVSTIRKCTAVALLGLAAYTLWTLVR